VGGDSLALRLASARQRYLSLQRRADNDRNAEALLAKALAELGTVLEELRVAHEQLIDSRAHIEKLHQELREQSQKYWQLFDDMPDPYIVSKSDSTIVDANRAAAQLLNVSQRFLVGKTLSVFVCEDRARFLAETGVSGGWDTTDLSLKLRPRERAPLVVKARVRRDADRLRWILHPTPKPDSGVTM
jgi:PAS domain-containing protein